MRLRNSWLISLALLGGCSKAPEQVSIDLTSVEALPTTQVSGDSVSIPGAQARSATLEPLPEIRLYQGLSQGDRESIERTLLQSRQDALERALRSLRRQYQSQVDAEREAATAAASAADLADWESTTDELRSIFERYARLEAPLRMDINALDRPKRGPAAIQSLRVELEESLRTTIDEHVAEMKAELAALEAAFQEEITPVLEGYRVRKQERDAVPAEIAAELQEQFEAEAQRQAAQIVETTFNEAFDFDAVLSETVDPVDGKEISEPPISAKTSRIQGVEVAPPDDPAWEAQLFAEAKGYKLTKPGLGVRDVTEEFLEWRKQYALGRSNNSQN